MANSAAGGADDYNAKIIAEFRANQGRVGGPWARTPMILIHHIGARSGIERVSPLGCFPQADGRFAIGVESQADLVTGFAAPDAAGRGVDPGGEAGLGFLGFLLRKRGGRKGEGDQKEEEGG